MIAERPDPLTQREGRALGSPLRLIMAASDADVERAWAEVVRVFADVDSAMSRFRDDSALTLLCRRIPEAGEDVPRMLVRALVAADRAKRITGGSFDPRVVGALERIGYVGAALGAARPATVPDNAIGDDRILSREGRTGPIALSMPVDLGGIGKGLALRWAADAIEDLAERAAARGSSGPTEGRRPSGPAAAPGASASRTPGFLIDAGGDIVTSGYVAPGQPWSVGIENPTTKESPAAVVSAAGRRAIATSSISRLHWEQDGRQVHHLIDPRTGEPGGGGLVSVTVAGPDPAWSEVWSKALFLEGAAGIAAAARRRGMAAWWIATDGTLEMTPAARQRTTWVSGES